MVDAVPRYPTSMGAYSISRMDVNALVKFNGMQ